MSSIRRIPYTKPIPPSAEIFTRKGERFARYKSRNKTVVAPLSDDGQRLRLYTRKYYAEIHGVLTPLATNEQASLIMLGELTKKAELKKAGAADPFEEHHDRPLVCPECNSRGKKLADGAACDCPAKPHLTDYRRHLEARDCTPDHIVHVIPQCVAVLEGIKAKRVGDLDADAVAAWLAQERATGMSTSTSNHYLKAAKAFSKWLVKTQRTDRDRLLYLSRLNQAGDVRRKRRDLSVEEITWLLSVTKQSTRTFRGLTGGDRFMIYGVALGTGFRASELASLTAAAFDLDGNPPTITGDAGYTKNGEQAVQPIPPDLADALRCYLQNKPAADRVWPGKWNDEAWAMIGRDLAEARAAWLAQATGEERKQREKSDFLKYRDADGRTADFHSLRHSYITLLARSGVHPKLAQTLARHSSITFTLDLYTHVGLYEQAAAVDSLPRLLPPDGNGRTTATGSTSSKPATESLRSAYAKRDRKGHALIGWERNGGQEPGDATMPKVPTLLGVESVGELGTACDTITGERAKMVATETACHANTPLREKRLRAPSGATAHVLTRINRSSPSCVPAGMCPCPCTRCRSP